MGQKVLVTAGAAGIGEAIARAFLAAGAQVAVCDVDTAALDALHQELPQLVCLACDVADRHAVAAMVVAAAERLGGLDVLVSNAGIPGPSAPVEQLDPDAWERVIQVNLNGAFYVVQQAIPHLRRSSAGVILIMSSVAGRLGYPNRSPYAASKWALIGLAKSLSIELGEAGIRVNAILPGAVAGPRMEGVLQARAETTGRSLEEVRAGAMANQSLKAAVDPREVAAFALFLASDAARSISGQALSIDGDMQRAS